MRKTILVDGMFCIYDESFKVNTELLRIVCSFKAQKILVVNGFREKGKKVLEGNGFEAFSLEEEGIKKNNSLYFQRLFVKYTLKSEQLLYFDHDEKNVETAGKLGIISLHYSTPEKVRTFLEENIS